MNALRSVLRAPRFAALLCLVLGTGIGASAAIWTTLRAARVDSMEALRAE